MRGSWRTSTEQLAIGPAAVMHAIADHVVDSYLDVVEAVEDDIDEIEEEAFSPTGTIDIEQIYLLKREVVGLRRAVAPLSVALRPDQLRPQRPADQGSSALHARREDHQTLVADRIASFDEMLTTLVQAALAKVGHAAEHGHAQDLGVGGDRGRADDDRRRSTA